MKYTKLVCVVLLFVSLGCQSQFARTGITDNRWLTIETRLGPLTLNSKIVYCPPNGKVCVDATDALNFDQEVKTAEVLEPKKTDCSEKPVCKEQGLCATRLERMPGHVFKPFCVASHDNDCKNSVACKKESKCIARNGACVASEVE